MQPRFFVGCACDHNYAEPTAAMLASLDANGEIPTTRVIVAAFGLTLSDEKMIRAGAGRLAHRLRFVNVSDYLSPLIDKAAFSQTYPVSVLGRLMLPHKISDTGARLLTLDSDMIVNSSLQALISLDLENCTLAAVHDPPRQDDLSYFNSGMMLIDVDAYKSRDIATLCFEWIARSESHPRWPDQDALNAVIGDAWKRLDRQWNYFHFQDKFEPLGYENATIAHFAANPKPWSQKDHPGRLLYDKYRDKTQDSLAKGNNNFVEAIRKMRRYFNC